MATIIEEIPIVSEEAQPDEVDLVTDEAPVEEKSPPRQLQSGEADLLVLETKLPNQRL